MLVASWRAASLQVTGALITPKLAWTRMPSTAPCRGRAVARDRARPKRFAFTSATRIGGAQLASTWNPAGRESQARGLGMAKSRSVFSGPLSGRQNVGVAVSGSTLGTVLTSRPKWSRPVGARTGAAEPLKASGTAKIAMVRASLELGPGKHSAVVCAAAPRAPTTQLTTIKVSLDLLTERP